MCVCSAFDEVLCHRKTKSGKGGWDWTRPRVDTRIEGGGRIYPIMWVHAVLLIENFAELLAEWVWRQNMEQKVEEEEEEDGAELGQ